METSLARRLEFGDFLRRCRMRASPGLIGSPAEPQRRTPGLRREEVARLASVGKGYYASLERGRDVRVSLQVLLALRNALALNDAETRHLLDLADPAFDIDLSHGDEIVTPAMQGMLDRLHPNPAYIHGRRWDMLADNAASRALFSVLHEDRAGEANIVVMSFMSPLMREFVEASADSRYRLVADFRSSFFRYAHDPAFVALVERLKAESDEFRELWAEHRVGVPPQDPVVLHHPVVGELSFTRTALSMDADPRLHLTLLTPVTDDTRHRLSGLLTT